MLPLDAPRNRAQRRADARAAVKAIKHPRRGTLDTFHALAEVNFDLRRKPLRAQPPVALPAGHISRQVRRAHARAMRAAIDAGTVAAPWRSQRVSVDCRVTLVGR